MGAFISAEDKDSLSGKGDIRHGLGRIDGMRWGQVPVEGPSMLKKQTACLALTKDS